MRPSGGEDHCPACGAALTGQADCPACRIVLRGPEAQRLRALLARVAALDEEWAALSRRRRAAADEIQTLRRAVVGPRRGSAEQSANVHPSAEWNVERIRTWLLWLGVSLLTASALTFTVVAWAHLGGMGRAALLATGTALVSGFAVVLARRLPATSQALAGLAIALALVDWRALQVADVALGVSSAAWWSAGSAIVGAFAFALGHLTSRTLGRAATSALLPTAAVLGIIVVAGAPWSFALGMALLAAVLVAADAARAGRVHDDVTAGLLRFEAAAVWSAATIAVLVAASATDGVADAATPAAVMLACGLAPTFVTVWPRAVWSRNSRALAAALTIAVPMGALLVLVGNVLGVRGLTTLAVVLGCGALVGGPFLSRHWRAGAFSAGMIATVPGVVLALGEAGIAILGPLAWFGDVWTGSLDALARDLVEGPRATDDFSAGWTSVGSLAAGAVALGALAVMPESRRPGLGTGQVAATAALFGISACCLAPVAGDGTVVVAFVATTVTATAVVGATLLVDRRRAPWTMVITASAFLAALPAAGWAATTPGASVAALAVLVIVASGAATLASGDSMRAGYAGVVGVATIALVGVVPAAEGVAPGPIGFAMVLAAGAVLLGGLFVRRDTTDGVVLELAGAAGLVVGVAISWGSSIWFAGSLTATVPMLALGLLRRDRRTTYGLVAMLAALGTTWAWLANADVRVVEAYTLPAAAVAFAAGAIAWRTSRASSWWMLGPAIVVALGPTLTLAVTGDDVPRAIAVGVASFLLVVLGAVRRLQAPLVLGSTALLVLAVDTLGPTAVRLPRWLLLAVVGALLVYLGATFERRRDDVRALRGRLSDFV